jgi:cation/acetate symporter
MGLGAMVSGTMNPADSNMAAPLLARSFGELLFAIISAIAFATVLGTVSGLIVAASGAVAHDLFDRYFQIKMDDHQKVMAGKISAFVIGGIAIVLGILFQRHERFLPGRAGFAVAASANLPAIIMLLFWKKTTAKGIAASIVVGHCRFSGIDRFFTRAVHPLRFESARCADPAQQPGYYFYSAELYHARSGITADR